MNRIHIRGELTFDGAATELGGAAVEVRVSDATRLDAPALMVDEMRIAELPQPTSSSQPIPFELRIAAPEQNQRYVLWARVDLDRDGRTSRGDFITMQDYPVQTGPFEQFHRLRLRRVN